MPRRTPASAEKAPKAKASAKAKKPAPGKKPSRPSDDGGSPMFKLLFYLAVLGGIGYAAARVPVGGKTTAEHLREIVRWDQVADKGAQLSRELGKEAQEAIAKRTGAGEKPSEKSVEKAPEKKPAETKPAPKPETTKVATREKTAAPVERITKDDRQALDRLVPR